jgi:hypothetical protein
MHELSEFVGGIGPIAGYVANRHAPKPDRLARVPRCAVCQRGIVQVNWPGRTPFWRHDRYTFTEWQVEE